MATNISNTEKGKKTNPLIPQIRFKGFAEEWKNEKIGNVTSSFSGGTPTANNPYYYNGTIPFIRSAEIHKNKTELFITETGLNNSSAKMVSKGDILYALYGATSGEVGRSKINGAINQAILAIYPTEEFDENYLTQWLKLNKKRIINKYLQGGQGNLSAALVKEIVFISPKKEEQTKIGALFQKLDQAIKLQSKQLASQRRYKAAMLQKLFPQKGKTTPELRFKGFTGEWETLKLEKLFKERKERSAEGELLSVTLHQGVVKFSSLDRHDNSSSDKSNYRVVYKGDIAYNSMRMWQGASGYSAYNGIVSPAYTVIEPRKNVSAIFFSYLFKASYMIFLFESNSQGLTSDTWNLRFPAFKEIKVKVPPFKEQEKIGAFFQHLDQLIETSETRLTTYQNLKKALLQRMFV